MTETAAPAPAPEPAPAPSPAPAPAPAPATPPVAWYPDADAEMVGHIQNKAWKGPADAAQAHRALEKAFGADRAGRTVVIPTGDDQAEWDALHTKLGRPATPDGYGIKAPEGADPSYAKAMSEALFKAGVSTKAAQQLIEANGAYMQGITGQQEAAQAAAYQAEEAALRKDWGNEYSARREIARRAAVQLGMEEAQIDALQSTSSYSKTLKLLAKMGDLMGEHGAAGIGAPGSFGMTPEGAAAERKQLMADKDWRTRAMVKDSKEWVQLQKLDAIIAPKQ